MYYRIVDGAPSRDGELRKPDFVLQMTRGHAAVDGNAKNVFVADTGARTDGVRITTAWASPTLGQGDTIVNTLDIRHAVAAQTFGHAQLWQLLPR